MDSPPDIDERPNIETRWLVAFFALTLAFWCTLWLPKVAVASGTETGMAMIDDPNTGTASLPDIGAFGPAVAAVWLVYHHAGRRGISHLLKQAIDFSFPRRWFVLALSTRSC